MDKFILKRSLKKFGTRNFFHPPNSEPSLRLCIHSFPSREVMDYYILIYIGSQGQSSWHGRRARRSICSWILGTCSYVLTCTKTSEGLERRSLQNMRWGSGVDVNSEVPERSRKNFEMTFWWFPENVSFLPPRNTEWPFLARSTYAQYKAFRLI